MRKVLFAAGGSAVAMLGGCTAILGSFDVGAGPATLPDGGRLPDDGSGGGPDSSSGGLDASAPPLACTVGTPRSVDSLVDATATFDRVLGLFRAGNQIRIVTTRHSVGATVLDGGAPVPDGGMVTYTFDPKSNAAITPIPMSVQGEVLDVRRQPAQAQLVALAVERPTPLGTTNVNGVVVAYAMPDSDPKAANRSELSTELQAAPEPKAQIFGALGLYAQADTFYWALSVSKPSNGTTAVLVGKKTATVTPAPTSLANDVPAGPRYAVRDLVRSGNDVYIFNYDVPSQASPLTGTGYFVVSESSPGAGKFFTVTPAGDPGIFLVGQAVATNGIRLALGDVTASGSVELRAGDVATPPLPAIDGTTIPVSSTFPTPLDAPLNTPAAAILGDDLVWVGSPGGQADKGHGINFQWFNYLGGVRASNTGTSRFALDHSGIKNTAVIFTAPPTTAGGTFDLAWTEDDGNKSMLFYAAVECQKP